MTFKLFGKMFGEVFKNGRIGVLLGALLAATMAWAVTCHDPSKDGSTGTVFSVFKDGTIDFSDHSASDQCHTAFLGGSTLNVEQGHLLAPGAAQPQAKACKDALTEQVITASGTPMKRRKLDPYPVNTSSTDYSRGDGAAYVLPVGSYNTVSLQNRTSLQLLPGTRIRSLSINGCNGEGPVDFAPGVYFIDSLTLQAGCNIRVSGSAGTAVLNLKTPPSINGGPTCLNISDCTAMRNVILSNNAARIAALMSVQAPARLQLNVYEGDMNMQNSVFIAAGIYLHQGSFQSGTGPLGLIGEVLAKNVKVQNNAGTYFYNKATSMPAEDGPVTPPILRTGYYTLAPAAVPVRAKAGDYTFVPSQMDVTADNKAGSSGHLQAYALQPDGSLVGNPAWDVADTLLALDRQTREAKLFTQNDTNGFVSLRNADTAAWGTSDAERAMYPNAANGAYLAGRDPASLLGRPWRTAPIIVGNTVLFATDDGFLYSVDRKTGTLNWAWMPRQIMPLTADPKTLMDSHPWGQIGWIQHAGTNYITGTALAGALHFTLQLKPDGSLDSVKWIDYRAGTRSPASPFGGAAPSGAVRAGSGMPTVAYVVDNRLVVRNIDGSGSVQESLLAATATSNLLYVNQNEIYFGDATGTLRMVTSTGNAGTSPGTVGTADPILSVTGAYLNSGSGNTFLLLAQTLTRVTAFKRIAGVWSSAWHSEVGGSSASSVPAISVDGVTDGLSITASPTIADGRVFIPVTRKKTQKDECDADVDVLTGYVFGPLDLDTGSLTTAGVSFRGQSTEPGVALHELGRGESLKVTVGSVDARSFVYGHANDGKDKAADGWGQFEFTRAQLPGRINWRELTNFF